MKNTTKVEIQQVDGAEERNEANAQHLVVALLRSHFDPKALDRLPPTAILEDMIIQFKESVVGLLVLADELHRVHSGMGDNYARPCSEFSKNVYENTLLDLKGLTNKKPKMKKKVK